MNEEEKAIIEEKIIEVYKIKNIDFNDKTLYKILDGKKVFKESKDMPLLEDLYKVFEKNKYTEKFKIKLIPFVKGSMNFFNNYTNVKLNNKLIIADIYELGEENLKYGMYIFTDLFWDKVKVNRKIKKSIYLDEIWRLIGVTSNKDVAKFIYKIFKTIRKYGGSSVAITQDISDLFSLEEGIYGKSILNNSSIKSFFSLEEENIKILSEYANISDKEKIEIKSLKRGESLMFVGEEHILTKIEASEYEKELIDKKLQEGKIKKIITAIGNNEINKIIKKQNDINIIGNDIPYKEGVIEIIKKEKNIDILIINYKLDGEIEFNKLINEIFSINKSINIYIIIKKDYYNKIKNIIINKIKKYNKKNKLKNIEIKREKINEIYLNKIKKIFFKNDKELKDKIINIFNEKNYNKNYNNCKIINISGLQGSGKTTISYLYMKKQKLNKMQTCTISDEKEMKLYFEIYDKNNIQVENKDNYKIIKFKNKYDYIFLKFNISNIEINNIIKELRNKYNYIYIDNYKNKKNNLIKYSDEIYIILEPNIIKIKKSKQIINYLINKMKINKDKISLIINKYNKYSISIEIIEKIFYEIKINKIIKINNKYNLIFNENCYKKI